MVLYEMNGSNFAILVTLNMILILLGIEELGIQGIEK
jgi:hypothetical protein